MSRIQEAFTGGKAFIPFITAGYPDLETTRAALREAQENGADLIEIGIPFSDPTAEGPVIQTANVRALDGGITTDMVLDFIRKVREDGTVTVPMVFMTYANVIYSYHEGGEGDADGSDGSDRGRYGFCRRCAEVGIDGLILPDVPFEEKDQFAGRQEIRTILQSTMRGGSKFWNFESYNPPISRDNWANRDSLEAREDRLCHKSSYLEAPPEWLGEQFFAEAEYLKENNERAYLHEYLGEAVGNGSEVFENIEAREITDEEISRFDRVLHGLDWGYYPDPWAYNDVYFDSARQTLYIFGELTKWKAGNEETAELLKEHGLTRQDRITADSAEPKSIADYNKFGLRCLGAEKGPGSVDYSMKWLQSLKAIVIDPKRCQDTYAEFSSYEYMRTKDGEIISGYPDANNHHIDSVRYATEEIWKRAGNKQKQTYQSIWG